MSHIEAVAYTVRKIVKNLTVSHLVYIYRHQFV